MFTRVLSFYSFPVVVLFLKILLSQHDLDKPFSGGLGSFKLYVLVASHVRILIVLLYLCSRDLANLDASLD